MFGNFCNVKVVYLILTVAVSTVEVSEDLLSQHYCELRKKPFYPSLLHYMTSGPVVVMVRPLLHYYSHIDINHICCLLHIAYHKLILLNMRELQLLFYVLAIINSMSLLYVKI